MVHSAEQFAELLFGELALDSNATYFVAYSGGLDSTVLLHLMHQAQRAYGFSLTALHVNHNLQAESTDWSNHCARVCRQWGIPIKQISVHLDDDSELTARNARYQWFKEQIHTGSVLLTAHHRQDRAETLLFNLMRGAGSRGLSSLRSIRPFHGAKLVRPMLDLTRQQVKDYAIEHGLNWVEDPSNNSTGYSRNQIRQQLLPALTKFRPDAIQNIARAAANLESENGLLNEVAICDLVEVRELPRHPLDRSHALCYHDLANLSPARQANLLRFWLHSLQLHTPSKSLLNRLLETFTADPSSTTVLQEQGCQYRFYQGFMYVMPALEEAEAFVSIDWRNIDQPVDLYQQSIRVDATSKLRSLIQDRQPQGVRLASRQHVNNPKALQGHSLNLKKWLQEIGIPPWRRQTLPLLTINQSTADVVLGPVDQQMQSDWVSLECPLN